MIAKSRKNRRLVRHRAGMTIVETALVSVLGLGVMVSALTGYKKLYIPQKGDSAFAQISLVLDAIERTKLSNSGVYPIGGGAKISSFQLLGNELGGTSNFSDVADWTYSCASGSGQTVTLVTSPYSNNTIAQIASAKITSNKLPFVASALNGIVTVTLTNVTCK